MRLQLLHTRGVSLRNICLLCTALLRRGGFATRDELIQDGQKLGLRDFERFEETNTRVRHHLYALQALELVDKGRGTYLLVTRGVKLANLTQIHDVQPGESSAPEKADLSLPEPIKAELRRVLCSSAYVRHWWLKYFMPADDFLYENLVEQAKDVVLELVPTAQREILPTTTGTGRASEDTGYRLHSFFTHWKTLYFDQAMRREIHQGLRQWCLRVELISEVSNWDKVFEVESEFYERLESRLSRLSRLYVVEKYWSEETPITEFETMLERLKIGIGRGSRVHIPELIISLALQERISIYQIHRLLDRLYWEYPDKYVFEPTSELLLTQPGYPFSLDEYVKIDGAWRTNIVVRH